MIFVVLDPFFDAPAVEFNAKLGGSWRSPMGPKPKPRPCKLDCNMEDSTAQHCDTEINLIWMFVGRHFSVSDVFLITGGY